MNSDDDLMDGRFKPKRHRTDVPTIPPSLAETSTTTSDAIKEFLAPELKEFFSNKNDSTLFLKALSADGIDSWCLSLTYPFN